MRISHLTNEIKIAFTVLIVSCFMFLDQSCNGLPATPTPTLLPPSTATEENAEFSDCLWKATGKAWNDNNQDGIWNAGEKPLSNVKFWVDDTLNNLQKVNDDFSDTVSTNADGRVEISVWLPGCPDVEFEVYTEPPQNCQLTTQKRISVNPKSQYPVYSFGFICH